MRLRSLLLSLVVLATACAGSTATDETTVDDSDTTQADEPAGDDLADAAEPTADEGEAAVAVGPQAPQAVPEVLDFQATSVSGETVSGGDFAGQDLMLWFWAPW